MSTNSKIQWTDHTWNIAVGCTKVDEDCKYCYMYRQSLNNTRYKPNQVVRTKTVFNLPLKIKEPSRIFTCSLTDFFHEDIDSYRMEAWDIIRQCPQHTFQILTKRPERILDNLPPYWDEIKDRVWLGISVGSNKGIENRFAYLKDIKSISSVLFLSLEPLYEHIDLKEIRIRYEDEMNKLYSVFDFVDWVIVGGESGNEKGKYLYRGLNLWTIEKIVEDCREYNVPIFVKQLGTYLAKSMMLKDRHGGDISEFPKNLRIRKFPNL